MKNQINISEHRRKICEALQGELDKAYHSEKDRLIGKYRTELELELEKVAIKYSVRVDHNMHDIDPNIVVDIHSPEPDCSYDAMNPPPLPPKVNPPGFNPTELKNTRAREALRDLYVEFVQMHCKENLHWVVLYHTCKDCSFGDWAYIDGMHHSQAELHCAREVLDTGNYEGYTLIPLCCPPECVRDWPKQKGDNEEKTV